MKKKKIEPTTISMNLNAWHLCVISLSLEIYSKRIKNKKYKNDILELANSFDSAFLHASEHDIKSGFLK